MSVMMFSVLEWDPAQFHFRVCFLGLLLVPTVISFLGNTYDIYIEEVC